MPGKIDGYEVVESSILPQLCLNSAYTELEKYIGYPLEEKE